MAIFNDESTLVLLVQNSHTVFCYFNVSAKTVKEFKDRYGDNSWENSKPVIKVYCIENGDAEEIKTIYIDELADNWYINLDRNNMDVFIKLGRMLPDDSFAAFAVSNTVTTPSSSESFDTSVYYVDVSKNNEESDYASPAGNNDDANEHELKPYPFMEGKKKLENYPKTRMISEPNKNEFRMEYYESYMKLMNELKFGGSSELMINRRNK